MIAVKIRKKPDRAAFQLYYIDPLTGLEKTKSARTDRVREAERAAAHWQHELESSGANGHISWDGFRVRFADERLAGKPKRTRDAYRTALNHFERIVGHAKYLADVNASVLSQFQSQLRREEMADTSIACHLRHVKAALRWAAGIGLIARAPAIAMPKLDKRTFQRGRPLSEAEFDAMLAAVEDVVDADHAESWKHLLRGLRLSGLRLGESLVASWDEPPIRVELDCGRFPRWVYFAEGHKARRDELTPLTPDFVEFLSATPLKKRTGRIFTPMLAGKGATLDVVGRTISAIGAAAKIAVNASGKTASAHDLRRSFGTRWAMRVRPITLKALMRHQSIETTLRFYVDLDCDDVGAELWGQAVPATVPKAAHKSRARKIGPAKTSEKARNERGARTYSTTLNQ